ncbi:MAG TPA: chemotaxis protein CheA [Acidimicrobiales bacterium]|nr:chemotaxis protein CheA [Acidimicrobiales bacterium]
MPDNEMDEVVQEFLVESTENLDQLDRDLVALEADPRSADLLASVFRTFHTIKGTSGFLGFPRLEEISHNGENLLSKLRDGLLELDQERTDVLLEVVDAVRGLLESIEGSGEEGDADFGALVARLQAVAAEPAADAGAAHEAPTTAAPAPAEDGADEAGVTGEVEAAGAPTGPDDRPVDHKSTVAERSVRVDVDLLDALMRQVGELVLARNQINSHAETGDDPVLLQTVQRLSLIVSELQEGVMKTRMQPIEQLWAKLPRVVRDLASQFGKQVALEMEGGETELDRSLLEAVKDPLTHLVRNAIDHGIEMPEARHAAAKPTRGTLTLRAFHEGGQVVMEVADDGAGIDVTKVGAKAVERGLITPEQLSHMSEREVTDLVFRPGFSTAGKVTNVSGRGVGMDVVRTNIERIGGTVDLMTAPGRGTTFRIKIPLTLAIIPALLVRCHDERYAIAQASLVELVHLEGDAVRDGIEYIGDAPVYRLRGKLLPLVSLDRSLGVSEACALDERESVSIVVLQADNLLFGAVVDGVLDTQEIVVKPLGRHFKQLAVYAGATILGDGGVALILDVNGLAMEAGMGDAAADDTVALDTVEAARAADLSSLVVLRVGDERRVAVPLDVVARLEEVAPEHIELAGGLPVLQYRGDLLPLIHLHEFLGEQVLSPAGADGEGAEGERAGELPVVVYSNGRRQVGFVATEILDIVEDAFEVRSVGAGRGVIGSAVVQGRVTDLLDIAAAVHAAVGDAELRNEEEAMSDVA